MENLNLIHKIVFILINFLGVGIIFWVYFSGRKIALNKLFVFWMMVTLFWINSGYFMNIGNEIEKVFFLTKVAYGSIFLWFAMAYFFFIHFLDEKKKFLILNKIIPAIGIPFFFLTIFADSLIIDVIRLNGWGYAPIFSPWGKIIFYGLVVLLTFFIIQRLLVGYFKSSLDKKLKFQYFFIGIFIFATMNVVFNVIFPLFLKEYRYFSLGNYSTIFLLGFTAYAIVKRELFGIKVVLTQFLVATIAILLLIQTILAPSIEGRLLNGGILAAFLFFGYLLIKSVLKEIKQREKIEEMAKQVQQAYEAEKRAHKIEKTAREELERLDKAKDQFLLATQHHMRTPLTSTRGFINMLLEGSFGKLKPKVKRALTISYDSIVRSIKLVNELLDVSQFQLGKEVIRVEPNVKITPILKEIVEELSFEVKEKGIYLKLNRPKEDLPLIKADHQRLKVALTNIIDNGVKYTKKGGVTVSAEVADSRILIVVKDTGMGISEKEIPLLFTRTFERGESAEKAYGPGKGIGLYLAAQIIKAHQGRVWAESEGENKGSVFYVELPL